MTSPNPNARGAAWKRGAARMARARRLGRLLRPIAVTWHAAGLCTPIKILSDADRVLIDEFLARRS